MVTKSWAYDVICPIGIQFKIINLVEKIQNTCFQQGQYSYHSSYEVLLLFLLFLGSSRVIFLKIIAKPVKVDYLSWPNSFFIPK